MRRTDTPVKLLAQFLKQFVKTPKTATFPIIWGKIIWIRLIFKGRTTVEMMSEAAAFDVDHTLHCVVI